MFEVVAVFQRVLDVRRNGNGASLIRAVRPNCSLRGKLSVGSYTCSTNTDGALPDDKVAKRLNGHTPLMASLVPMVLAGIV